MSTSPPPPAAGRRRGGSALAWLLALLVLAAGGWFAWQGWQARTQQAHEVEAQATQRLGALEQRIDALHDDQRAQAQRLQQAATTNRVLRDELLGIGQRAALLEDSISELADPERNGAQALRLDELELVLGLAQQRLRLAGDLDGARRGYALAANLLDGIHDPAWLSLRQTLAQERSAIGALGEDPRAIAAGRLQAFAAALPALPITVATRDDAALPWWRRAFARVIDVRHADTAVAIEPGDRAAGLAALQLELTLAQAAAERRDRDGYRNALARADAWTTRLWPDSPQLRERRQRLRELRELPLAIDLPTLGTTLGQLRAMRAAPN
ncbi:uroporphyrinogen-III C-methyltransferase [Luteimonas sp. 22616]|uniref:uroporphyrinogen-III C-methyltransferase n=1 Tax=Luteimonas sp. 22616 TaxID=3453951 RepID=UPI003F83015A